MKTRLFLIVTLIFALCLTLSSCFASGDGDDHEHSFSAWSTEKSANCTTEGVEIRKCDCGELEKKTTPALGHSFIGTICTRCGLSATIGGKLYTPSVSLVENMATWANVPGATKYEVSTNGIITALIPTITSVELSFGDTIQVRAIGDGVNTYDSEWSAPLTFNKYKIEWSDGVQVIHTQYVSAGELPVYSGPTPTKESAITTYTFAGWAPALVPATVNTTYTAIFVNDAIDLSTLRYDGGPVTIRFYHTMGKALRDVLDDAIARFNVLYPNITIEHEQVGSYDDVHMRIKTEITGGNHPNLAYCYPDHVAIYNEVGAALPLNTLIASTVTVTHADGSTETIGLSAEQINDFIPGFYLEGAQFEDAGTMYSIPLSKSTELLYYNKTFFDANGLTPPTTWAEIEDVCERILEIDPGCIPLGYDSEANWFITMCEQYGSDYTSATGEYFIFDNDTNYDFVERFREWYQKGYVTTLELNGGKYSSTLFTATTGQKCYMSIGSSAGAKNQKPADGAFEVGVTSVPQINPSNPKAISQGPSLCIFGKENTQEVVASWLFVKFLATDAEFQARFSMVSGYVPVIKSVAENPIYADALERADGYEHLTSLVAKKCLEQANAYFTPPAFNGSSTARDQVGILIQSCFTQTPASGESVEDMIRRLFAEAIDECEYRHPRVTTHPLGDSINTPVIDLPLY